MRLSLLVEVEQGACIFSWHKSNQDQLRNLIILNKITALPVLLIALLALAAVSCGADSEPVATAVPNGLIVLAATSDIGLGTARIPLNIQLLDGSRIDDAASDLEVTYTAPDSDEARTVTDLTWRVWPVRSGVYTATMNFDQVGMWKLEVRSKSNENLMPAGSGILVRAVTEAPNIGDPAPLSKTKTSPEDGSLKSITSAFDPDPDLYAISFDDAVATGKPTVISFSTPAYCATGTCGPQTEVLGQLDDKYKGRANFIHVEIFDNPEEMLAEGDPSLGIESPVIHEWEFHTDPWTFVVEGSGIVAARFEAFVTFDEIEETLIVVLDGA